MWQGGDFPLELYWNKSVEREEKEREKKRKKKIRREEE